MADATIKYNESLKGTSTEIGKTNASLMYGQYNSFYNDNSLTISQSIPFPTVMIRQANYYNATTKGAELIKKMTENELISNVKISYFQLQFAKAKQQMLFKQDSLYTLFLSSAALRLKTGEGNMLEKATAESQLYEIKTFISQNEADILIHQNQLKTLLNTEDEITSTGIQLEKKTLVLKSDSLTTTNPALHYFKQQITIAEAGKNIEKSKLMPDLTLGYFNQSLYGTIDYRNATTIASQTNRFQGISIGVAFPLWAKPQMARIKANKSSITIAEENYRWYQKNLQGQYEQAFQEYQKQKKSLEYYEQNALPTAEVISKHALKNYQSGNIGYIEFSQGLKRALDIQTNYLSILLQYNQSIINIEFLIGNN